ncbi:MAG: D-alanine--D-alanine ligase family protein [Saprospiraceae bacterium]
MKENKPSIVLLVGGPSTEHKISLLSGSSIFKAIDKNKYRVFVVGIDHETRWWLYTDENFVNFPGDAHNIALNTSGRQVRLTSSNDNVWLEDVINNNQTMVHLVFPVLHGHYGEDGILQGILSSVKVPYSGANLMASSIGMDKDIAKRLWRDAGIPIANFICIHRHQMDELTFEEAKNQLGIPMFIKPVNAGSSVGVNKVKTKAAFLESVQHAFLYDTKILIEEAVIGKELECAVLGNEQPKASVIGEIIPKTTFYSYEAKYLDDKGATMAIPANIDKATSDNLRQLAVKAFKVIGAEGLSRVDFFLTSNGKMVINEINTLPGFTSISMYPKLWEATGLPYTELIDQIIQLGFDRYERDKKLLKSI